MKSHWEGGGGGVRKISVSLFDHLSFTYSYEPPAVLSQHYSATTE